MSQEQKIIDVEKVRESITSMINKIIAITKKQENIEKLKQILSELYEAKLLKHKPTSYSIEYDYDKMYAYTIIYKSDLANELATLIAELENYMNIGYAELVVAYPELKIKTTTEDVETAKKYFEKIINKLNSLGVDYKIYTYENVFHTDIYMTIYINVYENKVYLKTTVSTEETDC